MFESEKAQEGLKGKLVEENRDLARIDREIAEFKEIEATLNSMRKTRDALRAMTGQEETVQKLEIAMESLGEVVSQEKLAEHLEKQRILRQQGTATQIDLGWKK